MGGYEMIVVDTHTIIWNALKPENLTDPHASTCLPAFYPPFFWWVLVAGRGSLFKRGLHKFEFPQILSRYV